MNRKQAQARINEALSGGMSKSAVFAELSGKGIKDCDLAYLIASYADTRRCNAHETKVDILIFLTFVQALIGSVAGFVLGAKIGPNAKWIVASLAALAPMLFALGFYKHMVGFYNGYILLSIIQLPKTFEGFSVAPVTTALGIVVGIGTLAYVWYVREKIFPDFALVSPKKIRGQYAFTD